MEIGSNRALTMFKRMLMINAKQDPQIMSSTHATFSDDS